MVRTTVYIPEAMSERLHEEMDLTGSSVSHVVKQAIYNYFETKDTLKSINGVYQLMEEVKVLQTNLQEATKEMKTEK